MNKMNDYGQFVNIEEYDIYSQYLMVIPQQIRIVKKEVREIVVRELEVREIVVRELEERLEEGLEERLIVKKLEERLEEGLVFINYFNEIIKFIYTICHLI